MNRPLAFHPDVERDVDEAYRWYEREQPGVGEEFLAAIEKVYDRLRAAPEAHQLVHGDVRRALPKRFPYGVFYRVLEDRVEIIAVYHTSRDPSGWQSRA